MATRSPGPRHAKAARRRRVLILAYEGCWSRTEALREDAPQLASLFEATMDLDIFGRAPGLKMLSDEHFETVKRIGAYVIGKQEDEAKARPH